MEKVELRPAYEWDCSECGTTNLARVVVREIDPKTDSAYSELIGLGDDADGVWTLVPTDVQCSHCGMAFEAEYMEDEM